MNSRSMVLAVSLVTIACASARADMSSLREDKIFAPLNDGERGPVLVGQVVLSYAEYVAGFRFLKASNRLTKGERAELEALDDELKLERENLETIRARLNPATLAAREAALNSAKRALPEQKQVIEAQQNLSRARSLMVGDIEGSIRQIESRAESYKGVQSLGTIISEQSFDGRRLSSVRLSEVTDEQWTRAALEQENQIKGAKYAGRYTPSAIKEINLLRKSGKVTFEARQLAISAAEENLEKLRALHRESLIRYGMSEADIAFFDAASWEEKSITTQLSVLAGHTNPTAEALAALRQEESRAQLQMTEIGRRADMLATRSGLFRRVKNIALKSGATLLAVDLYGRLVVFGIAQHNPGLSPVLRLIQKTVE